MRLKEFDSKGTKNVNSSFPITNGEISWRDGGCTETGDASL